MNDNSYIECMSMSDKSLMEIIGKFVQHHRLIQNKSQSNVAKDAGISRSTLSLLERGEKVALSSLIKILRVLDLLYVIDVFKVKEEISPIEYAKIQKNKKQRARNKNKKPNLSEDLGW
jgi:transcriptional regulator with XRE-family HTH domain